MLAGSVFLTSCNKDVLKGEGATITQPVNVTGFTSVNVNGSTDVHIIKGTNFNVEKKGFANLLQHLDMVVVGGVLHIGFNDVTNVENDNTEAFITMPSLTGIGINGNCNFDITGNFTENKLTVDINGYGEVHFNGGSANEFTSIINGNGLIKAFSFSVIKASHKIIGNGKTESTVTETLDANISGKGTIYYKGDPTNVTSNISGQGHIIKL
jgi:hypothetical protein